MSYIHLTTPERVKIETYLELEVSIRFIARRVGQHPSTVSRENRRNLGYESERYVKMKVNCGSKTKLDEVTRLPIIEKLRATWSPEHIVGRFFDGEIVFSTIYRWIYVGIIDLPATVLHLKDKRGKTVETRGRFNIGLFIAKRQRDVRRRDSWGQRHFPRVATRTPTAFSVSSSQRVGTSRRSVMANSRTRSPKLTGGRGNISVRKQHTRFSPRKCCA